MPTIPGPVLVASVLCETANGLFTNVSYWEPTSTISTSAALNNMCNDFNTIFSPLYVAVLNSGSSYRGVAMAYHNGTTFLQGAKAASDGGAGAGTPVSDQNAVVLRKHTNLAGRQNRGRYFIGGMDSTAFDVNFPDEVAAGAMLTAYRALGSAYGSDHTLNGQVCHARHWDRKDNVLRPIVECVVASRIASRDDRRRHAPSFSE